MLTKDPTERATVNELIFDEWLTAKGTDPIILYEPAETAKSSVESLPDQTICTIAKGLL